MPTMNRRDRREPTDIARPKSIRPVKQHRDAHHHRGRPGTAGPRSFQPGRGFREIVETIPGMKGSRAAASLPGSTITRRELVEKPGSD